MRRAALTSSLLLAGAAGAGIVALISTSIPAHAAARPATLPASIPGAVHPAADNWALALLNSSDSSSNYWYPETAGAGAQVYVMDTGVQADLTEFNGHVTSGFDATEGSSNYDAGGSATVDCHGHGTSVASIVGAANTGVAPAATIIPVRVLPCAGPSRDGSQSIITGLDWIIDHHDYATTGIINLSLGFVIDDNYSGIDELQAAIQRALDAGFFVTAAAGNDSKDGNIIDSCVSMPGKIPGVFTVGAATTNDENTPARADFSNAGSCIDAWAPGTWVPALDAHNPGTTLDFAGTSAATPEVAGLAALLVGEDPTISSAQITERLTSYATPELEATAANTTWADANGTKVQQPVDSESTTLVVHTPFDMPHLTAQVAAPSLARVGSSITINWVTPDLHGQSPVTDYDITIVSELPGKPGTLQTSTVRVSAADGTQYRMGKAELGREYLISVTAVSSGMPGQESLSTLVGPNCLRWCPSASH